LLYSSREFAELSKHKHGGKEANKASGVIHLVHLTKGAVNRVLNSSSGYGLPGAAKVNQDREGVMSKAVEFLQKLGRDEDGAALIEYTVLLGIMLVAVIGTIVLVGTWISGKWTALNAALALAG
jgi:pilus assembly protein Flp/PilA